ncbi:cell division protein FtsX [Thiovibrio frasassiensis]|jgi:cell division transport system permease protein|uniref:Cell division protein FtsX n=1 Tax=Thiovibrio frasassiensis TaxID=2984131 RepID=A0A9X4MLJ4_9BACT|nr:permease-like cell division protein FtsX [Thiovibrio frasassiensis]MDG4477034.1 ABC transporter permease [Thiovibrio frasassiensis]
MHFLAYILRQTGKNLKLTWGTQVMTLLTVTLSVLIFAFFFLVYTNMLRASARLGDDVRLIVYLDQEINKELRPEIEKKIRTFGPVEKIVFVSRAEAFSRLSTQLDKEKDVLNDLGPDFLPPSIEVYPLKNLNDLTNISQFSDFLLTLPHAAKVQSGSDWLRRFGYFTNLLRVIVLLSGGLLILTMTFIISYTLRLTVLSRQGELEILRLLGATSAYIRLPLLLEGMLQGFLGSSLGLGALYLLYQWIAIRFSGPGFLKLFDFAFFPPELTGAILLAGIVLCTAGSLFSIRRFIRI